MSRGVKLHIGPIHLHCILGQGGEIESDLTILAVWMLRPGFNSDLKKNVSDDFTELKLQFRVTVKKTWKQVYIYIFLLIKKMHQTTIEGLM